MTLLKKETWQVNRIKENQGMDEDRINSLSIEETELLLKNILQSHGEEEILRNLNLLVTMKLSKEKRETVIKVIESFYIDDYVIDLAPYLCVLYYRNEITYLAKYYLSLIKRIEAEMKAQIDYIKEELCKQSESGFTAEAMNFYDFRREYTYQGESKIYSVHSFSKKIGKNMTVLKTSYGAIMFDCGAGCGITETDIITEIEMLEFFKSIDISPDDILAVVISHAHLDHYGSIMTLINLGIDIRRIYIEDDTKELIQQVAKELPSLDGILPVNAFFMPFQRIKITSFKNGHILGSVGYIVTFDERNVIYSGDYCVHSQKTVAGLDVKKLIQHRYIEQYGVDCFITETTYGKYSANIEYKDISKVFKHFVTLLVEHGYKVFIPSFAIGRSQEVALLLNDTYSVLIDGLATKISRVYENLSGMDIFNTRTRYQERMDESDHKEENFDSNDIIIASSGMLSPDSTSYNYVKDFLKRLLRPVEESPAFFTISPNLISSPICSFK